MTLFTNGSHDYSYLYEILKTVAFILSMIVFVLAIVPCTDGMPCEDGESMAISVDHDHDHDHGHSHHSHSDNEKDDCTPFCTCSCCGILFMLPDGISAIMNMVMPWDAVTVHYTNGYTNDFHSNVWHPPSLI